jgi:hypothetical protein
MKKIYLEIFVILALVGILGLIFYVGNELIESIKENQNSIERIIKLLVEADIIEST